MVASAAIDVMAVFKGGPLDGKAATIQLLRVPAVGDVLAIGMKSGGNNVIGKYRILDTPFNGIALKMLSEWKEPKSLALSLVYEEPQGGDDESI